MNPSKKYLLLFLSSEKTKNKTKNKHLPKTTLVTEKESRGEYFRFAPGKTGGWGKRSREEEEGQEPRLGDIGQWMSSTLEYKKKDGIGVKIGESGSLGPEPTPQASP